MRLLIFSVYAAFLLVCGRAQSSDGKQEYLARCAGCHGEDGTRGGHGPNGVDVRRPRATSQEAVRELIRKGIPEAGMPAFPLPDVELNAIATFFMTLKTPVGAPRANSQSVAGDVAAGERFFAGKGNCASCH